MEFGTKHIECLNDDKQDEEYFVDEASDKRSMEPQKVLRIVKKKTKLKFKLEMKRIFVDSKI